MFTSIVATPSPLCVSRRTPSRSSDEPSPMKRRAWPGQEDAADEGRAEPRGPRKPNR